MNESKKQYKRRRYFANLLVHNLSNGGIQMKFSLRDAAMALCGTLAATTIFYLSSPSKDETPSEPINITVSPALAKGLFKPVDVIKGLEPSSTQMLLISEGLRGELDKLVKISGGKFKYNINKLDPTVITFDTNLTASNRDNITIFFHAPKNEKGKLIQTTWCDVERNDGSYPRPYIQGADNCLATVAAYAVAEGKVSREALHLLKEKDGAARPATAGAVEQPQGTTP